VRQVRRRIPYVQDGEDPAELCRRSAQIDREEANTLNSSDARRDELLLSATEWEMQAESYEGSRGENRSV
jgi:hypothetical protein